MKLPGKVDGLLGKQWSCLSIFGTSSGELGTVPLHLSSALDHSLPLLERLPVDPCCRVRAGRPHLRNNPNSCLDELRTEAEARGPDSLGLSIHLLSLCLFFYFFVVFFFHRPRPSASSFLQHSTLEAAQKPQCVRRPQGSIHLVSLPRSRSTGTTNSQREDTKTTNNGSLTQQLRQRGSGSPNCPSGPNSPISLSWPSNAAPMAATLCGLGGPLQLVRALPWPVAVVVGFAAFIVAVLLLDRFVTGTPYPPDIPLIREPEGTRRFSLRTRLAYYIDCKGLFEEAWDQYLKHGRPVVLPGMGVRKEVILPPAYMRWVNSQPKHRLSVSEGMAEVDQAQWCLGHTGPVLDGWQGMLVKTDLNRALEGLCAALDDELTLAFDTHFGTDTTTWREIDLRDAMSKVIAQASARFTVGLPLCHNEDYLKTVLLINDILITTAGITSAMPSILRPVVGTILGLPMRFMIHRISQWLVPLWKQRVHLQVAQGGDKGHAKLPQDHIQMMARYAVRERPGEVEDYGLIVRRLCAQNFGAVHQTTIQASNLLLNVLASDTKYNTISVLREESIRVLNSPSTDPSDNENAATQRWTKARVRSMVFADSASRETLRLHSFANRALIRKVISDGVSTPDGHSLPRGSLVSFLSWPTHTNPDAHADPLTYDPFRFARDVVTSEGGQAKKTQSFVTTAPDYLSFGHGKHACPGRFIVDFELKMIIAHVFGYYDVRFPEVYHGERPANQWHLEATLPPLGVRVCVRRKEHGPD